MECGEAAGIPRRHIGALGVQQFGGLHLAFERGVDKRRGLIVIARIDGGAAGQQALDGGGVAFGRGIGQRLSGNGQRRHHHGNQKHQGFEHGCVSVVAADYRPTREFVKTANRVTAA